MPNQESGLFKVQIELKNQTKAVAGLWPSVNLHNVTENNGPQVWLIVKSEKFTEKFRKSLSVVQ